MGHAPRSRLAVAGLFLLPAAHPLMMPLVGVPSHLLWWVHTLPVAMLTFACGRSGLVGGVGTSLLLVVLGERLFGAGYGTPADWATVGALSVSLTLTNGLMAGFALFARRTAHRYRSLFDATSSGILRLDGAERVIAANAAAQRLLALEPEGISGTPMTALPGLESLPHASDLAGRSWSGAVRVGTGRNMREVHLAATAVHDDARRGYQVVLVDRTFEVAQEREIERQSRLSTLGEALAGVAHELKNPLQVIASYGELGVSDPEYPDRAREDFGHVLRAARKMSGLVRELLGFSRDRSEEASFRVEDVVRRVMGVQRMSAPPKVRFEEVAGWRGEVAGSPAKVEQILTNLLTNAADALGPAGGLVRLCVEADDEHVVLRVRDDGPGIDPAVADRLFEPFVTTKPEGSGTGLGLAISRRLAATMGGDLRLASGPGEGAVFELVLARADGAPHRESAAA